MNPELEAAAREATAPNFATWEKLADACRRWCYLSKGQPTSDDHRALADAAREFAGVDAAVAAEREAIAQLISSRLRVDTWPGNLLLAAIRARGTRAMSADEMASHEQTRREEREACARLVEGMAAAADMAGGLASPKQHRLHEAAAAVRARSTQPTAGAPPSVPAQTSANLDSRLGEALRASGISAADALAVQSLYATAGQSGSHRIVSALRAIEAWLALGGGAQ